MTGEHVLQKSGVIYGRDVHDLFKNAQENNYAIPAINVTSSSTVVAALEAAKATNSPIILQLSQGGAGFFAGQGIDNKDQTGSIAGATAAAHYIRSIAPVYGVPVVLHTDHCAKKLEAWFQGMLEEDKKFYKQNGTPLYSSHMLDFSEETVKDNIGTCVKYLKQMVEMEQWLEMEIGITGGVEDGVNNESVKNSSMYTQPEDIWEIYQALHPICESKGYDMFSIAAGFGNTHGVYKPGNVKLEPALLKKHQAYVKEKLSSKEDKPIFFVFHGGSGSGKQEYLDAISYGVVKVNVDTDMQWAYASGVRNYMTKEAHRLKSQIGYIETLKDGTTIPHPDKPNKDFYDPRKWIRAGEKEMEQRAAEALKDFNTAGKA